MPGKRYGEQLAKRDRARAAMVTYRKSHDARDQIIRDALAAGFTQQQVSSFMNVGLTTIYRVKKEGKG